MLTSFRTFGSRLAMTATALAVAVPAVAAPAGEASGEASGGTFPPFDPTYFPTQIFWLFVSFGLLYFVLSRVFLPRIGETLEERSNRIADDLDAASRMQRQAEEAMKSYEQSLAAARAKAHNVAESTRQAIDAEVAKELDAADAEAARDAEVAETRIRKIREEAMSNIETVAADVAQSVVEAVSGKSVTAAKAKAAIGKA